MIKLRYLLFNHQIVIFPVRPTRKIYLWSLHQINNQINFYTMRIIQIVALLFLAYTVVSWCEKTHFRELYQINDIDISPDGSMVVTGGTARRVTVWNFSNFNHIAIINFTNAINSVKFSKDQRFIAVAQGGLANILSASTFASITTVTGTGQINDLDFSWDHTRLLTCGSSSVEVYFTANWTRQSQVNSTANVLACRFQKDNKYATSDSTGKTNMYFAGSNTLQWSNSLGGSASSLDFDKVNYTLITVNGPFYRYFVYPSNRWLTGAGATQSIILTVPTGSYPLTATFAKDGTVYAIGTNANIFIYQNNTHNLLFNLTGTGVTMAAVFSYDSQYYLAANNDGQVKVFKRMCQSCVAGTYEFSDMCVPCTSTLVGCLNCANSSYCFACGDGYAIDTTSRNCKLCQNTMIGCVLCNSTTICTACSNLFYLTGNACTSCQTIPNCITCSSSTVCTTCNADFFLDSGTNSCISCTAINNCISCFNSSACMTCVNGYYLNTATYSCARCQQNCNLCYNATTCSQCIENYYLSPTSVCLSCPANCLFCSSSTTCVRCASAFYLSASSVCMPCTNLCFTCSGLTTCTTCIAGYYQNAGSCLPCSGSCLTCSSASACLSCKVGYYYVSTTNSCNRCQSLLAGCQFCTSSACLQCEDGFYFDSSSCLQCKLESACQTCQNATYCTSCISGYQYNTANGTCTLCPYGCSTCTSTVCQSCLPKFYLSAGSCALCLYNCPTCLNATSCLYCITGFYVNSTQGCSSCASIMPNCVTCTASSYCTSCQLGYMLNAANSSCSKCVWPCSLCNSTLCFECAAGYYLTAGTCVICPSTCSSCYGALCTSCVNGYYLSATLTCVNCQTLSKGCEICNQTSCISCLTNLGYYLNPTTLACGSCSSISNCLLCSNSTACILCSLGYVLSGSQCQLCSVSISNCQLCNSTGCLSCIDPYYLSGGACQLCTEGCTSCSDGTSCKQCAVGYITQGTGCTYCNNLMKGCEICSSTTVCAECAEGYILSGTVCNSCSSLMPGCLICSGVSTCLNCLDQYYYASPNSCVKCDTSMPGCAFCNSSSNCISCDAGYFKDTSNNCSQCIDKMCIQCTNASTCINCLSGYVANSTGSCQLCDSLFIGCILCTSTTCLQCVSRYYVNSTNQCAKCQINGCEVCNATTPALCATCSSLYFLNSSYNCVSCSLSMQGCLNCISSTSCLKCQIGMYLTAGFSCQSCFSLIKGCSQCTATTCNYCSGGYIMNGTTCATCTSFITGCQYCTSSTVCVTCQSGYYQSSNTCNSCTNIAGCLDCSSANDCNLCSDEYYLSSSDNLCHLCNTIVSGCVTCTSTGACKSCLGNYALIGGACIILSSSAATTTTATKTTESYKQLRLRTEYVNSTNLMHRLIAKGSSYTKASVDLTTTTTISMVGVNSTIQLNIISFQWPRNDYELIFYTNNPFGSGFNSFYKSIPSKRLLQGKQNDRLLMGTNVDLNYQFKLDMTESSIQAILPGSSHAGSLSLKSTASDPEFVRSIYSQVTYNYHYIGLAFTLFMFAVYFLKAKVALPDSDDQGEIVSHILLLKCGGVVFSLAYMEYIDYCYGFLSADLPWFNSRTSSLSSNNDLSPNSYLLFYSNMTLASTYLSALCMVSAIALLLLLIACCSPSKRQSLKTVGLFFYNFFEVGLIVAGSQSIQGAYYNNITQVTRNSLFYISGILIYVTVGLANIWMTVLDIRRINKLRVFAKATLLSLLYVSPIYLLPCVLGVELIFVILEYRIKRGIKLHPYLWIVNQILVNLSFFFLVSLADSFLSIVFSAMLAIAALLVDLYMLTRQYKHTQEIKKLKQVQNSIYALEKQKKTGSKSANQKAINDKAANGKYLGDMNKSQSLIASEILNSQYIITENLQGNQHGLETVEEELNISEY